MLSRKIKSNGYEMDKEMNNVIKAFERATEKAFNSATVEHFYWTENCDMVTVIVEGGYADYIIRKAGVYLSGYNCPKTMLEKFATLTVNDDFYSVQG